MEDLRNVGIPKDVLEARAAAEELTKCANNYGCNVKEFVAHLTKRTHRTLQQSVFGMMLACMMEWAKDAEEENFDLRNEATVKLSKKIVDTFGDEMYLPLI